jgi:type IV pilus assembly protein PilM
MSTFFATPRPTVGIEFATDRVSVVRLDGGTPPSVAGYAHEAVPAGAIVPALNAPNIINPAAVADALRRALSASGARSGHAALVIPDPAAKISLLRFENVPAKQSDLDQLVRWQVTKSLPFRVEDAQVSFVPGIEVEGGREFVVTAARRDVVQQYEAAAIAAGLQPGVVDLATFNYINAAMAAGAPEGDWLLVHVASDYLTLAILRGAELIFIRHRGSDDDTTLADVVHQTAMYYEDRLQGGGFSRAVLAGAGRSRATGISPPLDGLRQELAQRLQTRVDVIDPRSAVTLTDRVDASQELLDTLAPAVGLLLRERTA